MASGRASSLKSHGRASAGGHTRCTKLILSVRCVTSISDIAISHSACCAESSNGSCRAEAVNKTKKQGKPEDVKVAVIQSLN